MESLLFILFILIVLFIISLKTSDFLLTPQIGYVVGFILQVVFCIFLIKKWNIHLQGRTIFTILFGATEFVFVSVFINWIISKIKQNKKIITIYDMNSIYIARSKLILLFLLQVLTLIGYIIFMNNNMSGSSLALKIYNYRYRTADMGDIIEIPKLLSFFRLISSVVGYILSFVLVYNILHKNKKNRIWYICNIGFSMLLEGILGARGGIFNFIIAIFSEIYIIKFICFKQRVSIKMFVNILVTLIAFLIMLPLIGEVMGRPGMGPLYEVAVYVGAPLKNLDTFLKDMSNYSTKHFSTFYGLLNDIPELAPKNIDISSQRFNGKWQSVNGYTLGNVYTTYANFWYDGGIKCLILDTFLMAFISQIIYQIAFNNHSNSKICNIVYMILYLYFFPAIIFSFFTNRFLNQFFSLYLIKFVIAGIVILIWLFKIKIIVKNK